MYNTYGQFGIIVEAETNVIVLELNRNDYQVEQSKFPVAFFYQDQQYYIVHGTDWNHIDLYNLTQKKNITERLIEYED